KSLLDRIAARGAAEDIGTDNDLDLFKAVGERKAAKRPRSKGGAFSKQQTPEFLLGRLSPEASGMLTEAYVSRGGFAEGGWTVDSDTKGKVVQGIVRKHLPDISDDLVEEYARYTNEIVDRIG